MSTLYIFTSPAIDAMSLSLDALDTSIGIIVIIHTQESSLGYGASERDRLNAYKGR
jgi:hypothetical protein